VSRQDELRRNLAAVWARIESACDAAGRDPGELTLVVVTKTYPAEDVRRLADLGVTDIGENRDQEAAAKHAACADLALRWHFVGQLQTNKAASVAAYADIVHSVDRARLVEALSRAAAQARRRLTCLVQVSLEEPPRPGRGGAPPEAVPALAESLTAASSLRLGGLMAVAPLGADPRPAYARLAALAAGLREQYPTAVIISAGMSEDLEEAVAAGATHLRIGTAVLGSRPPLR
jgi:pyridoxal phosphate enzyme (YggS family)